MQWVLDNWVWLLLGAGMVVMHLFGHGGHGRSREGSPSPEPTARPTPPADTAEKQRDQ